MLSLLSVALSFVSLPNNAPCPEHTCPDAPMASYDGAKSFNGCGAAYPPGTYSSYIDTFNGVQPYTIATAGECIVKEDWQTAATRQKAEGVVCATGPFDGHFAFAYEKGLADGSTKTVMRIITNSEIRPRSSSGFTGATSPQFFVSTNPAKGGWGQPTPSPSEMMQLYGATLMYLDVEREAPYNVLDMGHAIKKVYTIKGEYHNKAVPTTAKSGDVFSILSRYEDLHNNVRADQDQPRSVSYALCQEKPEYCGLYAHCGSSFSMKHAYSYASETTDNVKIDGVGFEDDIAWVAHEGTYSEGGLKGVIQLLDVATGDYYQLPHVSVGVTETAFSISTGHPDYVAAVIMEYGHSGVPETPVDPVTFPTGASAAFGSSINLYIGKKDKTAGAHFLDRNGLGLNQGRVYHFVTDSGVTDTATALNWPASGDDCSAFTAVPGRFEPLSRSFDGRYFQGTSELWGSAYTNGAKSALGGDRMRMTELASQEWGSMSPTTPGNFAIAHTTLSKSKKPDGFPEDINTNRGTVSFFSTQIRAAIAAATGAVKANDGSVLPDTITASIDHVMQDNFVFPERANRGVDSGTFKPDGLVYLKDGSVIYQEDQSYDKVNGYAAKYDPSTCTAKLIAGATQQEHPQQKLISTPPYGAFTGPSANELTGGFDVSAALTVAPGASGEEVFNALDSKKISINTQIWNARGDGNSDKSPGGNNCLSEYALGWGGQMNLLHLPF